MLQSTTQTPEIIDDRVLVEAAKNGDPSGFDRLVDRHRQRLLVAMRHHVQCPILAEDIVQDALLKAFQYLDSFQLQSEFYTWLYRIAINSRLTHFRRTKRTLSLESIENATIPERSRSGDSPMLRAERGERQRHVREALARLEDHHRLILTLREFEEFDYQTIARMLGVKIGTVRSRLARARARLRSELTAYAADRTEACTAVTRLRPNPRTHALSPRNVD